MTAADQRTWPFWAPSHAAAVDEALELAAVGPGDRFIDLGCGDGQVVAAAAALGARARGIEADEELVEAARANLAAADLSGEIEIGDLFDPELDLDADVWFTYLAPATLQRLLPRLQAHRGARLVTVDFDVPGLVPTRRGDAARLYRMPGRARRVGTPGWPSAGTFVATVPDLQSLTCLDVVHPGGPVGVAVTDGLTDLVSVLTGADALDGPSHVAVDLRWEEVEAGTLAGGSIAVAGVDAHPVFVLFADDEEGVWELDAGSVAALARAVQRRQPPRTTAEVLDVVNGRV